MPESVIINKIKTSAAALDTSVDALIALRKAGATEAELAAMTAPLPPAPVVAPVQPQAIQIAGGLLQRTAAGDPYLKFPERVPTIFPNNEPSNIARLVSYHEQAAIAIPADHVPRTYSHGVSGELVITKDSLIFSGYLQGAGSYPKDGKFKWDEKDAERIESASFTLPTVEVKLRYDGPPQFTYFDKKHGPYLVGFHYVWDNEGCGTSCDVFISMPLDAFLRDLLHDFNDAIQPLLTASGITDVDKQLSPSAHFLPVSASDFPKYAAMYQAQLDHTGPPTRTSGGFWNGFAEVMQVAGAGATALQQGNDGGNTIAAQQVAMAQYNRNVASIESGGTAAPYVPPAATTTPAATATAIQPKANPTAGTGVHGWTYRTPLPNGDLRVEAWSGSNSTGYTDFVQCFTPGSTTPYASFTSRGPTEFSVGAPACVRPASMTPAPPPSNTVAPPVAYQKPPSTGGTVVSSGSNICPASGYIFTSYGDAATGVPCTPGQPVATKPGGSGGGSSGAGAGSTGDFVAGLDTCVAESFTLLNPGDSVPFLTFTNGCSQPIRLTWIIGPNGTPRAHTFATSESFNQTGSDQNDVHNQGGVTYYACPADHPVAVDSNGNQILTPVTPYKCAKHS